MYHEFVPVWKDLLTQGLEDDGWPWDWTSMGTSGGASGGRGGRSAVMRAKIVAKESGIWAAGAGLEAVSTHPDAVEGGRFVIDTRARFADGARIKKGDVVAEWKGPARLVLAFERPFLNLAQYVCGVATRTAEMVALVEKACPRNTPRVVSTRKTLPGYRDLAVSGVIAGGGKPHRISLGGGILIKENHIAAAGGIARAIEGVRAVSPHLLKVEIEVRNESELAQALKARAEVVMLDNFTPDEVKRALKKVDSAAYRPCIEVSGGINTQTVASYAIPGVDVISVGSLTHSVKALDLSMIAEGVK